VIIVVWVLVVAGSVVVYPHFVERQTAATFDVPGSESDRAEQVLAEEFPSLGDEQDVVVFQSEELAAEDPAYQREISDALDSLQERPEVEQVVPPTGPEGTGMVSDDGRTAVASVTLTGSETSLQESAPRLQELVGGASDNGVSAYLVGYSPLSERLIEQETASTARAESIGVPVALGILLLATGAVVAAGLPLVLAVTGVVLSFGVLGVVSYATTLDSLLSTVVPMIGLGVGIDYTLFIVSRFREELMRRSTSGERPERSAVEDAVAMSMGRTGKTILFSGIIVMLCLSTLLVVNSPSFSQMGFGAALAVGCALLVALTLLPAMLGLLGHRVEFGRLPWRRRVIGAEPGTDRHGALARWARLVMRRPVVVAVLVTGVLLVAAVPTLNMRLGIDLGIPALEDTPVGQGQQILSEEFAPGFLSPIQVAYTSTDGPLSEEDLQAITRLDEQASQDPAVAQVSSVVDAAGERQSGGSLESLRQSPLVSEDGESTYLTVVPSVEPDSAEAMDLVERLRGDVAPDAAGSEARVLVGGSPAEFVDVSDETRDKLWVVIGLVLALSFVFLTLVFRSLLLPLKAILMNLLATGASFGLLVWVFQQGHLEELLGFEPHSIVVYLPLILFALLFGLSMDYEVFLVRRIQESWRRTGDNEYAVTEGLEHTALPITAAAAIMVAVFGSFVAGEVLEIKQIGFALAVAIFVDATLVRIVLVPAVMRLAGRANWWLPRWLDRRLPSPEEE
jgi:RND superfamily putative drug exporter